MSELGTRPGCALLEFVEVKQVADRNGRHHGPFSVVACVVPAARKVAAVSCGITKGTPVLDLDYIEDSAADADANFVLIEGGHIAEVQATAEGATYDEEALLRLLRLARLGCDQIFAAQAKAVAK